MIIMSLQVAAKPPKFTLDFLKNMGYTSTNDRGIVPLFKRLGFLTDDSVPTVYYDQLRDPTTYKKNLAARIRELYAELFTINLEIYKDSEANVKGAISRVTGGNEESVKRVYSTFKALCSIADFSQNSDAEVSQEKPKDEQDENENKDSQSPPRSLAEFHYNIQIHLPATTDISVYNAIFKSLKDNLFI
jgi:cation transport regulator ChaB